MKISWVIALLGLLSACEQGDAAPDSSEQKLALGNDDDDDDGDEDNDEDGDEGGHGPRCLPEDSPCNEHHDRCCEGLVCQGGDCDPVHPPEPDAGACIPQGSPCLPEVQPSQCCGGITCEQQFSPEGDPLDGICVP